MIENFAKKENLQNMKVEDVMHCYQNENCELMNAQCTFKTS